MLASPEAYINFTDTLIDVDANVTDETARNVLIRFIDGLIRLIEQRSKA